MKSVEVRSELVDALQLDLVGPTEMLGSPEEVLPQAPSRWYLTGFLVPSDAKGEQRADEDGDDEVDSAGVPGSGDDAVVPEPASARRRYLPASIGLSVLIPKATRQLTVRVRWGDYELRDKEGRDYEEWWRTPRSEELTIEIPASEGKVVEAPVPDDPKHRGLRIAVSVRPVSNALEAGGIPKNVRCASVFLVNRRVPSPDDYKDKSFAFQTEIEVLSQEGFVPRPNLRSVASTEWDDRVADLQFRDTFEFVVGHNVAAHAEVVEGECRSVSTCWIPRAEVERVEAGRIDDDVERSMDRLAELTDGADAAAKLGNLTNQYRNWITGQSAILDQLVPHRRKTCEDLLERATVAANRIDSGIALLNDPQCLTAFQFANRAMATAAKRRASFTDKEKLKSYTPRWRPFQLAFLLMNLDGIADPKHYDREVVDLLFFPTGGGKTEAYLGLAAFTIVLRRLKNPGVEACGLTVLMRYTLRLLTLDQLGRASTLICALELQRQQDTTLLGDWPFEIGLWVGRAATPNRMGYKGSPDRDTARARTITYVNDDRKPIPIPLEECPWCGTKFNRHSFQLLPNPDRPTDLRIKCADRDCEFSRNNNLPILAVDDPIYRRLPCFMIATVDKFAAMPWTAEVGAFFGRVQRFDKNGFYGPNELAVGARLPGDRLAPPELIIQDELHLISGPLGTMVGLYEAALDELCTVVDESGKRIRPKIIASTATVRKAEEQVNAIFDRRHIDIFPPPGPDRRDSFFAHTETPTISNARLYIGVAAQGRSPKIVMLRVYLALLGANYKWYASLTKKPDPLNPADPYMTLLGYFNSLRELGGARRLIEDEVRNRLTGYEDRKRLGDSESLFKNRQIAYEPVELTSRVSTSQVSDAKRRLGRTFNEEAKVDVAIATNMISVGLDITRLGLMVVFGQPKTTAEYIQTTSRVGRDKERPGLVVTILNIHKPRDRSHYERFAVYHNSFYRNVESTSVTPYSPRALDRGLAGAVVSLARHALEPMTPPRGASEILRQRANLDFVAKRLAERARDCCGKLHDSDEAKRTEAQVFARATDLLDVWSKIAYDLSQSGSPLQYQQEVGSAQRLLHDFLSPELNNLRRSDRMMKFRANRSLRDVEPDVNLWMRTLEGAEVEEPEV